MWSRKDLASDVQALHFPQRPKSQAGGRGEPLRLRSRPPLEGSRQNSHPGGTPPPPRTWAGTRTGDLGSVFLGSVAAAPRGWPPR